MNETVRRYSILYNSIIGIWANEITDYVFIGLNRIKFMKKGEIIIRN